MTSRLLAPRLSLVAGVEQKRGGANRSIDQTSEDSSPSANPKYKTEMCRSVFAKVPCKYGDNCQFAHADMEMRNRPHHNKYKTIDCKNFHQHGYCYYGPKCDFRHNEPLPPNFVGNTSTARPDSGASSTSSAAANQDAAAQQQKPIGASRRSFAGQAAPQRRVVAPRYSLPFLFGTAATSDGESPEPSDCGAITSYWSSPQQQSSRGSPSWSPSPPPLDLAHPHTNTASLVVGASRPNPNNVNKQPIFYQSGGDGVYHVIYV